MKIVFLLAFACAAFAQTLPPVNTLTAAGITCTFTVVDAQMSVAVDCVLADGTIQGRTVKTATTKGDLIGSGPIQCLYATDGAATPTVRLQCMADDDVAVKIVLDGVLAPVTKKRQWWLLWR